MALPTSMVRLRTSFPRCRPGLLLLVFLAVAGAYRPVAAQPVTQPFTFSLVPHTLPHAQHGTAVWGDVDGDGDLDVLLTGLVEGAPATHVYRNDGRTDPASPDAPVLFTRLATLEPLVYSTGAWADYDRDGDLDLAITGSRSVEPPYQPAAFLYRNDGGTLTAVPDAGLPPVLGGSLAWGDADNDGDLDLALAGMTASETPMAALLRNDGGTLTAVPDAGLPPLALGSLAWGDVDGDGRLDLIAAGLGPDGFEARLLHNNGGTFTDAGADLAALGFASIRPADYDGDGRLDLLLTGARLAPSVLEGRTFLYRNVDGRLEVQNTELEGLLAGAGAWGDYDHDGDPDLLLIGGRAALGARAATLLRNDGGAFTPATLLVGALFASADWGDFDGDGDLDLITTGLTSTGGPVTNLYENRRQVIPPPPAPPKAEAARTEGASVVLSWQPPGRPGLSYNLRVGTTPGGQDVVAPQADPATGRRLLAAPGNAGTGTSWRLEDLPPGTYYWSVQAIDAAYAGSAFAAEQAFTVGADAVVEDDPAQPLPERFALHPGYPNPFSERVTLRYDLPEAAAVRLVAFNILGERVATLVDAEQAAGSHELTWDGTGHAGRTLPPGLYLLELRAGPSRHVQRLIRLP